MGKGLAQAQAIAEAQAENGNFVKREYFKLANSGDSAIVRFLEQGEDVTWCYCHRVRLAGKAFPSTIPCRNQDDDGTSCPACEQGIDKTYRGYINLIWRNAGDDGSDKLALWEQGVNVFSELGTQDVSAKGLSSRDFRITRKGSGLKTTYSITPADIDSGPQPMSDTDKKIAAEKYDLNELINPPSEERWTQLLGGVQDEPEDTGEVKRLNPFMRQ